MRFKVVKIVTVVTGTLLFLGIGAYIALESAFPVHETVIAEVPDATRNWEGVIVKRDAGATVSTSYSVRIRKAGSSEQGSEVLLIDSVERPEVLAVSWVQGDLRVAVPSKHQVFKKLDSMSVGNVKVKVTYIIK
ncbi:MAG: hypothetical protein KF844_09375 [Cryobacterium sp.]|nr:hypothetical protein [Cryobacterium sp.]